MPNKAIDARLDPDLVFAQQSEDRLTGFNAPAV
jgi:hypothetical protein